MKYIFDYVFGFFACIFTILGFTGFRNIFVQNRAKKHAKKVLKMFEKIDKMDDNRSDIDVLRKH